MTTATPIDNDLVTDLRLTIENTGGLYPRLSAVRKALLVRKRKGTYQAGRAGKAFAPIVAAAAKQYMRDVQGSRITPAERVAVCEELRKRFEELAANGELDWLLPASMQGVGFSELGVGAEFHLTPGGQKFKKTGDRTFVGAGGKALKVKRGARRRVHRAKKQAAKKSASSPKRKPKAHKKPRATGSVGGVATPYAVVDAPGHFGSHAKVYKTFATLAAADRYRARSKGLAVVAVSTSKGSRLHSQDVARYIARADAERASTPKRARVGETAVQLRPGYMYLYDGTNWRRSIDDAWETEMRSDVSGAKYVGQRRIDGTMCRVFQLTGGKVPTYAAATLAATEGL